MSYVVHKKGQKPVGDFSTDMSSFSVLMLLPA